MSKGKGGGRFHKNGLGLTRRVVAAIISGVSAHAAFWLGLLGPPWTQTLWCSWRSPGWPCQWRWGASDILDCSKMMKSVIIRGIERIYGDLRLDGIQWKQFPITKERNL